MSEKERLVEMLSKGELEILDDESEFVVGCEQCGECCRDREDILLSPHDVFHLVKATNMPVAEMLEKYTEIYLGHTSKLPIVRIVYRFDYLRANEIMNSMPGSVLASITMQHNNVPKPPTICPFLGRKDNKSYCRVHEHKPSVCIMYPLGRSTGYNVEEVTEKRDLTPKYFMQPMEDSLCPGQKKAVKNNLKSRVVDWVGGKDKKTFADRFWVLQNGFFQRLGETINLAEVYKLKNEKLKDTCFSMMAHLMYRKYDFEADDETFLEQYKKNTDEIIDTLSILAMHPNGKLQPKLPKGKKDKSA